MQYNFPNRYLNAYLNKCIQFIHLFDILPKVRQFLWNVKILEVFTRDSNMLQFWHQFTVKAAKCVTRQKSSSFFCQGFIQSL